MELCNSDKRIFDLRVKIDSENIHKAKKKFWMMQMKII